MTKTARLKPGLVDSPILKDPPFPLLLRMATPNAMAFLIQAAVNMTEVWYIGQLGPTALAAMAFVFPGLMLMQMLSGGAMGGAVASSIARALGAADTASAHRLIWHGLSIAVIAGLTFLTVFVVAGARLLHALGAEGEVFQMALNYGAIVFGGSTGIWITSILTGVFRGMGNMRFPAFLMACGGLVQVVLSGTLILGWFGMPALGMTGAAISVVAIATLTSLLAIIKLTFGNNVISLRKHFFQLETRLFADIFRVGALASVSPFLNITTIMLVNGLISRYGDAVVAGYGIGARLEFLLIPMVVGFGAAMNTMVGMNVGAGNVRRAEYIAFVGGSAAAALTGVVGITLALLPELWIGLFTQDPPTLAAGATYLKYSGWAFAFQGMGLSLYFAAQGAGRVAWPVAANFIRFAVGAGGAALAVVVLQAEVHWVFICLALGMSLYGIVTAGSIALGAWRPGRLST